MNSNTRNMLIREIKRKIEQKQDDIKRLKIKLQKIYKGIE